MADFSTRVARLSPEKRALLAKRMEAGERPAAPAHDAIAIVGIGCRFPGASSPEELWRLLMDGVDAVTEVPTDRWSSAALYDQDVALPGKMATRWGAFLHDLDLFDAGFFGIAPREAERMDPQQRLFLETAWEALEDAGVPAERLAGTSAGVFVGIHSMSADYYLRQAADLRAIDPYTATGTAHSIVANRLSYVLDLRGPSLAIDTACSSSLVAVHLACRNLRWRECDLAIAGGVNLILSPEGSIACSKLQMMAADGRCKTFDARADGFVRGEGCGVVVLKRLSDAVRSEDPILGVIRGSAVNQDGATNGLTAPNGLSQEAVVAGALQDAGMDGGRVTYVETHGTGTSLGDPIEVDALAAVLGRKGPDRAECVLGAIKTNMGHLEGAAGIASLIKAILCLRHRAIPPNLHFRSLNPQISLQDTRFVIPTEARPWPAGEGTLRAAGVSSFGFGGTNAHVILEEAPAQALPHVDEEPCVARLLPLSARSPEALSELAGRFTDFLSGAGEAPTLRDIAYTAAVRRTHHNFRTSVVGATREEWVAALGRVAAARIGWRGAGRDVSRGVVFVYSGQGSQWAGMGRELAETEPVFRAALERCDRLVRERTEWSLLEELFRDESTSRIDRTEIAQPAILALQVALTDLWKSWGVEAAAVVGHSAGEVAAAYAADMLSLEAAINLVVRRGQLMEAAAGLGGMWAVGLSEAHAREAIRGYENQLSIASVNAPSSCVISGDKAALDDVTAALRSGGVFVRDLGLNYAFHSRQMEPFQDEIVRSMARVEIGKPSKPILSTVTGRPARDEDFRAAYWARNVRETVRFADAVETLIEQGFRTFVEVGAHPVLCSMIERSTSAATHQIITVPSLRRGTSEPAALLQSLGDLYEAGVQVDWDRLYEKGSRVVGLPRYPWQRQRYWLKPAATSEAAKASPNPEWSKWFFEQGWEDADESPIPDARPRLQAEGEISAVQAPPGSASSKLWMVFADKLGFGADLVDRLRARGERVAMIEQAESYRASPAGFAVNPESPDDMRRVVREAAASASELVAVHMWSLGEVTAGSDSIEAVRASIKRTCGSALSLGQALLGVSPERPARFVVVTQGAEAVCGESRIEPVQATVSRLNQTIALEHPELKTLCVDLDPDALETETPHLVRLLLDAACSGQFAFRRNRRLVRRIRPAKLEAANVVPQRFRAEGTYLITGGLSGLGLLVAEWMAERGAGHLVLMGRSDPSQEARKVIGRLEQAGADVRVFQGNVGKEEDVRRMLDEIPAHAPLRGLVHSAGALDDGIVLQQDWSRFEKVMAPKVWGAWLLHLGTQAQDLDFFVLFSAGTSFIGSAGQANYAAANAFLDALAHRRHAAGLPALAINWGPWSETGMATRGRVLERLRARGFPPIDSQSGLQAFGRLLQTAAAQMAVIPVDDPSILIGGGRGVDRDAMAASGGAPVASGAVGDGDEAAELRRVPRGRLNAVLTARIEREAAKVMGRDPSEPFDPQQPLNELGLDSLMAVELRNALVVLVATPLPATLLFNYPTIAQLAQHLAGLLIPVDAEARAAQGARSAEHVYAVKPPGFDDLSEHELAALLADKLKGAAVDGPVG